MRNSPKFLPIAIRSGTATFASALLLFSSSANAGEQEAYALPADVSFPEGIVYNSLDGCLFTVGSFDGQIVRVNPANGQTVLVGEGFAEPIDRLSRGVLGIRFDGRGRLWMAGGLTGSIFVADSRSGKLLHVIPAPESGLLNDIVFAGDRAFITDTRRPVLWTVETQGNAIGDAQPWLDLRGTPLDGVSPNLNGIVVTPDGGALLVAHMSKGEVYRIGLVDKTITKVDLGGELVPTADGLAIEGRTLFVVSQGPKALVAIEMDTGWEKGRVLKRVDLSTTSTPATVAIAEGNAFVVDPQFDRLGAADPKLPFTITKIPLAGVRDNPTKD